MSLKVGGQKERNRSHIFVLNLSSNWRFRSSSLWCSKIFPLIFAPSGNKDDGILGTGATGNPTYLWEPNCVFCGVEPTFR